MPVLTELRAEASRIADSSFPVILELALKKLDAERWVRLRKRQTEPRNQLEEYYLFAVFQYTKAKINLHREIRSGIFRGIRTTLECEKDKWGSVMDRIECNYYVEGELCLPAEFVASHLNQERRLPPSLPNLGSGSIPIAKTLILSLQRENKKSETTQVEKDGRYPEKFLPIPPVPRQLVKRSSFASTHWGAFYNE